MSAIELKCMNNFKTFEGQLPIWLGDIDFMNESVKLAMQDLMKGLFDSDNPNIILSGVELKDGTYTDGIVCLGGEILPFEATTWDKTTQGIPYMTVKTAVGGSRRTKSGVAVDCYEYRTAVLAAEGIVRVDDMSIYNRVVIIEKENVVHASIVKRGNLRRLLGTIYNAGFGDAKDNQWNLLASITIQEDLGLPGVPTIAISSGEGYYSIPVDLRVRYEDGGGITIGLYQWGKCTAPVPQSYTFHAVI